MLSVVRSISFKKGSAGRSFVRIERPVAEYAMFFVISRFMQHVLLPPASLLFLMLLGFLIVRKKRLLGFLCIAIGFLLLFGMSLDPVGEALVSPIERTYPPLKVGGVQASAIVVLSGGVRDLSRLGLDPEPTGESLERLVKGVTLYRILRLPLVIVGGSGDPAKPGIGEAWAMARIAKDLGMPGKDIVVEATARNTLESAKALKERLTQRRIVLVTSAFHMRRAVAMFRKEGFDVIPAPTAYLVEQRPLSLSSFIPGVEGLCKSSVAVSEYLSYGWYSFQGDL
jgi:uncharacterized SAM-binding protein YcdF (DUF218 family)